MNLLLDLDGTLTDSRPGIVACFQHAFSVLGHPAPPESVLAGFIGPPIQSVFRELLPSEEGEEGVARAVAAYRERFADVGMFENSVYEGIPAALETGSARGARLFVATSKPRVFAERIVEHFELAPYFERVHGSELDGRRSEKGDLIAHVLESAGLLPSDSVMIGDRRHDVAGALANGVRAVGVLWGYGTRQELLTAGAESLLREPGQLDGLTASAKGPDRRTRRDVR